MRTAAEPPSEVSSSTHNLFLIGKNRRGDWVVRDQRGTHGGLFVTREDALRYALFENGRRPQAVVMVPEGLELDLAA
jgi:hypothetical protein